MNADAVIDTFFKSECSIKRTAKQLEISEQKVRKILINANLWKSELSEKINSRFRAGKSVEAIAEDLRMSPKNVSSYLPYVKCEYNSEQISENAFRIKTWRVRKKGQGN